MCKSKENDTAENSAGSDKIRSRQLFFLAPKANEDQNPAAARRRKLRLCQVIYTHELLTFQNKNDL